MTLNDLPNRLIGSLETHGLEHRCYNAICLFAGVGCLLAALFNALTGIGLLISLVSFLIGATFLGLYAHSRNAQDFQPANGMFAGIGATFLTATWFWNGGLNGSGLLVAMVGLVFFVTILKDRPYHLVATVLIPLTSILFLIEYVAPSWITPYKSRNVQFFDLYVTFWVTAMVISQVILMILRAYREERHRAEAMNQRLEENLETLRQTNKDLKKALAEVKTLSGLLPICASCQKIRNDKGYWDRIETYIQEHSEATFSHSLCPTCARQLYPDIFAAKDTPEEPIR